jgi:PAS domain S-box-containing protein
VAPSIDDPPDTGGKDPERPETARTLLESLPVFAWTCRPDGACDFLSRQWCEYTGVPEADQLGYGWLQVVHPEDRGRLQAEWRTAVETGGPFEVDFRIRRRDGEYRWFKTRATAIRDPAGKVLKWYGSNTDIDETKRALEALHASEERYRQLFESMDEGFALHEMVFDEGGRPVDYRFLEVNPAFGRLTGLDPKAILGHTVLEVLPGIERAWIETYGRVATTGESARFEDYAAALDRWFEVFAYRPAPGRFAVAFSDITGRKRAEEALRLARDLLALAQGAAKAGAWHWDVPSGRLTWSEEFYALFGLAHAEPASFDTWLKALHPDDRQPAMARIERSIRERSPLENEYRVVRPDGRTIWVSAIGNAIYDAEGKPSRMCGLCIDITDRKRSEEALQAAKAAAEAANRAKDEFLAALSHELRTPITPVTLAAQELEGRPDLPADSLEALRVIRRGIELEARLIDDLLDLSRIEHGKIVLSRQVVDLHALLDHTVQQYCASDCEEKALIVDIRARADEFHVLGDRGRLQQIFWNLLKNSIKFTPAHGRIDARTCNPQPGRIAVEVADTGIGIEPEALPRIFDAFEQGGRHGSGGLGLGLSIARSLVELHGGTIRAMSEGAGKGASFIVELPTVPAPQAASGASPVQVPQGRRLRILVVEDHPETATFLARLLRADRHEVETAEGVKAARRTIEAGRFDLVLCDLGLPDGSGLEVMRFLRRCSPDTIGIALTGYGMEEDIRKCRDAGFVEHMTKPIDLARLREFLARF